MVIHTQQSACSLFGLFALLVSYSTSGISVASLALLKQRLCHHLPWKFMADSHNLLQVWL